MPTCFRYGWKGFLVLVYDKVSRLKGYLEWSNVERQKDKEGADEEEENWDAKAHPGKQKFDP